jgi:MFS family permease
MQDEGFERETIGLFMLVAVLGGLAFQIPVGRLSDRFDRRIVPVVLSTALVATAVALVRLPHSAPLILPAAALFGGLMSTPLSGLRRACA